MIRFQCEQCAHKISVQDKHAGKRVKCQKCGSVGIVPAKSTIVDFHCESCGQIISVPQVHTGKKCRCPKCKSIVVVPTRPEAPAKSVGTVRFTCSTCNQGIEEPETSRGKLVECPHCRSYVPVPSEKIPAQESEASVQPGKEKEVFEKRPDVPQEPEEEIQVEETEPAAQRKLPWLIDIFLYPISTPGLITLGIIILIPLLINIAVGLLGPFGFFVLVPGILINFIISLYFLWYIAECIRDSADGGIRAPETVANTPGLSDLLWQWLRLLICLLLFLGPMGYYFIKTDRTDTIFWALFGGAVLFFPMGLLAVTMFDSLRGLNPLLLIASIFSSFFPYCGLILILGAVTVTVIVLSRMLSGKWVDFLSRYLVMYMFLVVAHLLGRFYWRYQEKLNWEV